MDATSDDVRQDIDRTRARLGREIDELADRTMPQRVVKRRWPMLREKAKLMSEEIMGTPGLVTQAVTEAETADEVHRRYGNDRDRTAALLEHELHQAGERAGRPVRGRPITAVAVAFAAGLALAWLLPVRSGRD